jgi:hypothetical protein
MDNYKQKIVQLNILMDQDKSVILELKNSIKSLKMQNYEK